MQLEVKSLLFDIQRACEWLEQFTSGKTLEQYTADAQLHSVVEQQFEIIGEALNKAIGVEPALADEVTDSSRIIAFRNRLIHAYASVSNEVV